MNEIKEYTEKIFDDIKHIDETGNEYWLAREIQQSLNYKKWRKFENVLNIKSSLTTNIKSIKFFLCSFIKGAKKTCVG